MKMASTMNYRPLGRSALSVSTLCLGTMNFGAQTDETDAGRIIAKAQDDGVNFIDTADVYAEGRSEEIVGRAIAAGRDRWCLATKVGARRAGKPGAGGLAPATIKAGAEASLRRLGTDRIDVYYLHKEDHSTPLEDTVRAMADLVRDGKIRHIGVSNHRGWRIAEICRLCDIEGIERPVVSQPYYNAMNRMPEVEHLPACDHFGLGVVPYSPLARGVLTGKYRADEPPPADSRAGRNDRRIMATEWRPESLMIAQEFDRHARARGITSGQFALGWVLNNRLVTSVLAGPRTQGHWDDYVNALAYRFTAEDEAFVDRFVTPGHPSTPGYNDPDQPIEGRVARS